MNQFSFSYQLTTGSCDIVELSYVEDSKLSFPITLLVSDTNGETADAVITREDLLRIWENIGMMLNFIPIEAK